MIEDLSPLIREELNVKEVEFIKDVKDYMNYSLKPNFRALGPVLGKDMGLFSKVIQQLDPSEVVKAFDQDQPIVVKLSDEKTVNVTKDQMVVNISSKEGFTVEMVNNVFIILDTALTKELIHEGYAREFISRVQQMRKSNGFEVSDHINIFYESTEEFTLAISEFEKYIMDETLAELIAPLANGESETLNLNGHETKIFLERIK